ncbi:MAG: autotransporter-associated beta strand repeat-containing protein, partial [Luteolibacter sp.]
MVHGQRQMEKLGRGIVVLRNNSTQTYIGWRLLGNDPEGIAFNLYRSTNGGVATKLNGTPLAATTDYTDNSAPTANSYTYSVKPVINGDEVADVWAHTASAPVTLPANSPARRYLPVPLTPTPDSASSSNSTHRFKFAWVGDLDGDGEYDFVLERTPLSGSGPQWIQAYKRDGTLLWQANLGPNSQNRDNINPGSSAIAAGQADNVTVFDLDGDGKAEVCVRTARGVIFNYGEENQSTITAANDEIQFISIIDGLTGEEKARAQVPVPSGWKNTGRVTGLMGALYSDGLRPSLFFFAKNRNSSADGAGFNDMAATWDYRDGVITQRWHWDGRAEPQKYAVGHQVRFADVNNDGKDEYVDIGLILKADGSGQINGDKLTEVTHGDRYHVADIDPDRPGLETFLIQQDNSTGLTTMLHTSDRSALIRKWYAGSVIDVGRGTIGAFVPNMRGLQMFSTVGGVFDHKGDEIYTTRPWPVETVWWDGDLTREFIRNNGLAVDKFNASNPANVTREFTISSDTQAPNGNVYDNSGRPQFWGDILGDWREEIVCAAADYSELRIYTTNTPDIPKTFNGENFRIYTLMHDPQYRIQTTTKGYVQSSYPSFYLGYEMPPPPVPPMVDAKLVWKGGTGTTTWNVGSTASWFNNGVASTFANGDTVRFDLSGDSSTAVNLVGTLQPGALTVYSPTDYTFTGSGTFSGNMTFLKSGAGSLVLPNTHTYTGKTTIQDGALEVNGNLQGSPVTVWGGTWGGAMAAGETGGRLTGTGQFGQPVTVRYRGAIAPGTGSNPAGMLTFNGGLSFEDGTAMVLDLSDDPTGIIKSNDRLAIQGNLSLAGSVKIVVKALDASLAAGEYTLATYTGTLTGGLGNLSVEVPTGTPYTLSAGGGAIKLTVAAMRAPDALTWRGSGSTWDLLTSQNWLRSGTPDGFVAGDEVTFDASGASASTVTLTGGLPIGNITVNSDTDYTFEGSGYLAGSGGLTKSGEGTLVLGNNNTYTGPTVINGGAIEVTALGDGGNPSAIGASSGDTNNFVLNGGTLRITNSQTSTNRNILLGANGGTFDIPAGSSIQSSGLISGSGELVKKGEGTLLLIGENTHTGGTFLNGGRIYLGGKIANEKALGTGTVTIVNGRLTMADVRDYAQAAWNIHIPTDSTARLDADGRSSLLGNLTGGGTLDYYSYYVRSDLRGNWSAFSGTINAIGGEFRMGHTGGYPNASLNIAANISAYYAVTVSSSFTFPIGELAGAAGCSLSGGPSSGRTITYQIGGKNTDSTFAGSIKNGSGTVALSKVGTGTLTLSGSSTYAGATHVSAGNLVLAGGALTSNVTVAANAGFGGNGSVSGNVSFANNSIFLCNPADGPLAVTGNLTFGSGVSILPDPGAVLRGGTYTLYTYTGTLTGTPDFTWSHPYYNASFNTSIPGQVSITLTAITRDILWTGAQNAIWNASAINWVSDEGDTAFAINDSVRFDDSSTVNSITISDLVEPVSVTVDATKNYSLSGSGAIGGVAKLLKTGSGNLTLNLVNSHTGGTTIREGNVILANDNANASAFGSGPIILEGGTVRMNENSNTNSATWHIVVPDEAEATLRMDQRINLHGSLSGSGILNLYIPYIRATFLGDYSEFSGQLRITTDSDGGDFRLANTLGLPAAEVDLGTKVVIRYLSGSSISTPVPIGNLSGEAGSTLSGLNNNNNSVPSSTLTWEVGGVGSDATFAGNIANGSSPSITAIRKVGAGAWILAGTSSYTGGTAVTEGSLLVTGSLGTTAVAVSSGATIGGSGSLGGNLTVASGASLALGVSPSETKGLTVAGTTTLSGNITVVPAMLGGTLTPGTYPLLAYSGTLGGSPTFSWNDTTDSGYAATFDTSTTGLVKITLIAPPEAPSGLTATGGNASVALNWNAVANAA